MTPISRRALLKSSMAAVAMAALQRTSLVQASLMDELFGRAGQDTSPITPNDDFYITSYDVTPEVGLERWTLNIGGGVRNPIILTYEDLMKGTKYGQVVKPGDSLSSTLYLMIDHQVDPSIQMPPHHGSAADGQMGPLSRDAIMTIKTWIDQGAKNN